MAGAAVPSTRKPTVSCSLPVFTKTVRHPSADPGPTDTRTVSSVSLTTVGGPAPMSGPKPTVVWAPKCVKAPTILTVAVVPRPAWNGSIDVRTAGVVATKTGAVTTSNAPAPSGVVKVTVRLPAGTPGATVNSPSRSPRS